ncbi:MAG: hypothetical protein KKB50_08305 [Planctomycetes bacterium]|nr:hypothetical protein [Planctomycetota bacterium]
MSVRKARSRTHRSAAERRCRSALARLVSQRGLLRGNLLERRRVCGKPNCKCTRGERHTNLYLVYSESGKLRQLFVPKRWEPLVRQWAADYHEIRRLLEELSQMYVEKLRSRED